VAVLNFDQIDKSIVEQFYKENRKILRKTAIKEQCLHKPENWWYFFNILKGEKNKGFREYIQDSLKGMASTSLPLAALYLLTSEKNSPDEKSAMDIILTKLNAIKGELRTQTIKSMYSCVELAGRLSKI